MVNSLLCVLLVAILNVGNTVDVSAKNKFCKTPDQINGTCIRVHDCKSIRNGILSRNDTIIEFAKKSYCGYDAERPLVCCKTDDITDSLKHDKFLPQTDVCGASYSDRIVGGIIAQLGEYPWMAALEYKNKKTDENAGIRCSGALINKRYVLTAGSCLLEEDFKLTNVRLGEWNLTTDPDCQSFGGNLDCLDPVRSVKINKITVHPSYDGTTGNNIGLIRLEDEIQYTEFILPICLARTNKETESSVNSLITISGWNPEQNGSLSSGLLQQSFRELSRDECKEKIQNSKQLNENESCGHRDHYDACLTNLGSPVVQPVLDDKQHSVNFYQIGIFAWKEKCDSPIVYTKVLNYMPWILDIISEE